ncbi:hypothetical protein [Iamia sp.]|uniref:hypothetical protein n=1 Tax=Iamia sp. TaxID=2722710 RepID=UPI002C46B3D4|nr:hypothetical protein [Iamia sp.]HXH56994.1 hypothetical protein [Iamia sp.]
MLTQSWAVALRRAGWRAIYHGVQHDPTGAARAVTLFDREGQHLPYGDPAWRGETRGLDEPAVATALDRYGYVVTRSDPDLPVVALDDLTGRPARRHRGVDVAAATLEACLIVRRAYGSHSADATLTRVMLGAGPIDLRLDHEHPHAPGAM